MTVPHGQNTSRTSICRLPQVLLNVVYWTEIENFDWNKASFALKYLIPIDHHRRNADTGHTVNMARRCNAGL